METIENKELVMMQVLAELKEERELLLLKSPEQLTDKDGERLARLEKEIADIEAGFN